MKKSFEGSPDAGRLNETEAHDEANMVRAAVEGATVEDYDNALKLVKELKDAAENESTYEKVATKILRGTDRVSIELLHQAGLFADAAYSTIKKQSLSVSPVAEYWKLIKSITTTEMKERPPLQAADLLAWASNRVMTVERDFFASGLESLMKQIIPSSWIVFDEARFLSELTKPSPCWNLVLER